MKFRPRAKLDRSQVEDLRGKKAREWMFREAVRRYKAETERGSVSRPMTRKARGRSRRRGTILISKRKRT